MNPQTERLLSFVTETLQSVKDRAITEVPLLAQEALHYWIFLHSAFILLALVLILLGAYIFRASYKYEKDTGDDMGPGYCTSIILMLLGGVILVANTAELAKTIIAPRLVLLEELPALIKKAA